MFASMSSAKSEAETEVTRVDLVFVITVKETYHNQIQFSVLFHGEPSLFTRSWRGGRAGYDTGSSFLLDFNILSHLKQPPRL